MPTRETQHRKDSQLFAQLCLALLREGHSVRFRVQGESMRPNILDGEAVVVIPANAADVQRGDVVLTPGEVGLRVHRVAQVSAIDGQVITRGDSGQENDPPAQEVVGKVIALDRHGKQSVMDGTLPRLQHSARRLFHRLKLSSARRFRQIRSLSMLFTLLLVFGALIHAPSATAQAALTITDAAAPTTVLPGGTITYTQVLRNTSGVGVTRPLTVTQNVPANTTFVSAAQASGTAVWTCALNAGVITCTDNTLGNYATGSTTTFTVVVTVNAGVANGTVITDTVNAKGNNTVTATASTNVNVQIADLSTTQSAAPNPVANGATITYTETVTNNSLVAAAGATLTQNTPANTTFVSATPPTGWTCATVPAAGGTGAIICTATAAMAASTTTGNFTIVVTVTAAAPLGSTITNTATVSETLTDPVPGNNTSSTSVTVQPTDLQLTQTASAPAVAAAANYTYTQTVTDNGPTDVGNGTITVYMQTPANTNFQAYAGTNWTCTTPAVNAAGPIVCTYNTTLANGATASTLTITMQVNAGTATGTTIQSSATVTNSATVDPIPSNNTSITSIVVEPANTPDLGVSIVVSPTPIFVSSNITYTLHIQNIGTAAATSNATTLTITLPASLTNVAFAYSNPANWNCNIATPTTCSLPGSIAVGSTDTITITATTPSTPSTLTATARLTLAGDLNGSNDNASAYTVVQPLVCATPGRDGAGGTLTGILNTYFPPSTAGTLASGSKSVTLGAASGASTPIALGDLLLIIQMQGATINSTNTSSYGDNLAGDPGSGSTNLGSSGLFEFVTATSAVGTAGGPLTFTGTGPTGGLLNSYSNVAATAPSQSLGTATAATWAANIATFTFPAPLPASVVPNTLLITAGFTPPGYNFAGATILTVNTATGVITVYQPTNPGASPATVRGTGSDVTPTAQQTYQVIRVPQYTSATLSSGLVPLFWNGSVGGVLILDVSSQLTLGGTVALDALGFRGGGGQQLAGAAGAVTDYVTAAPASNATTAGTNASKGEGIAGTPRYVAPATIAPTGVVPIDTTGGTLVDSLPSGSYARGAPGNAGGGGTDGHPAGNDFNSGGGAGGNGGTGGQGGYGWDSLTVTDSTDGGFGGVAFPASTSALVMGGGGGAGTTNNGTYFISTASNGNGNGIFSSGGAGGGMVIIHAGSVSGTGTITSNGQSTLSTNNDGTGGAGAGGSILVLANSGSLSGLTVSANGGNGGNAWPTQAPGGFPGERHGPGGGGGGGVIFLSAAPASFSVAGGLNGFTNTVQDSFGATVGQPGILVTTHVITETPGTQAGAYCASADLSVTNVASPLVVLPGGTITYTQVVANNGPLGAVNAVLSETTPANTTFASITAPADWTCTTPLVGAAGAISCHPSPTTSLGPAATATWAGNTATFTFAAPLPANVVPGVLLTTTGFTPAGYNLTNATVVTASSATGVITVAMGTNPGTETVLGSGSATTSIFAVNTIGVTFTIGVTVAAGTASGTQIVDVASITSGTTDPNLANNTATAYTTVGVTGTADLAITNTPSAPTVVTGTNVTLTGTVTNQGPSSAAGPVFTETIPSGTTYVSISGPSGWSCYAPYVGYPVAECVDNFPLAVNSPATITLTLNVTAAAGTPINATANVNSSTVDPNYSNNSATASFTVAANSNQADLAVTSSASPSSVTQGNNITYTQSVTNNGPGTVTNGLVTSVTFTDTIPANTTLVSYTPPSNWTCNIVSGTLTCTLNSGQQFLPGASVNFPLVVKVNVGTPAGTTITNTANVNNTAGNPCSAAQDPNCANNSATTNVLVASPTQSSVAATKTAAPEPVNLGSTLTYPLTVTNSGPAVAQNVVVTDPLPAEVTYIPNSYSTTIGSCSGTTTVTCSLGNLAVGSTAVITINVTANTFSAASLSVNSATVTGSTSNVPTSLGTATNATWAGGIATFTFPTPLTAGINSPLTTTGFAPAGYNVTNATVLSADPIKGAITVALATDPGASPATAMGTGTTNYPLYANSISTIQASTAVDISSFKAFSQSDGSVLLEWRTHEEARNLGFHVYREDASGRTRIDPSLIAGSALLLRGSRPQHAAKTYRWIDPHPVRDAAYWIEDLDINGTRSTHGPAYVEAPSPEAAATLVPARPAALLFRLRASTTSPSVANPSPALVVPRPVFPFPPPGFLPFSVADQKAVKISVAQEGWYHVSFAQLFAAGLDRNTDSRTLHLYAEGVERPLLLTGRASGPPSPSDAIEFYGTGIDTPFSAERVYWLVSDNRWPKRILPVAPPVSGSSAPASFPFAVLREDRTSYFAALLNGENNDNFFGAIITSEPTDQDLFVAHIDSSSPLPVSLDLALQGVTDAQEHGVTVQFNGATLGEMDFFGLALARQSFPVEPSLLQNGANTITLTALNGDNDVSLVQSITLHYAHTYVADADWLRATASAGSELRLSGFTNPQIRVFDITEPLNISELAAKIASDSGTYSAALALSAGGPAVRTILAFASDAISAPVSIAPHVPTFLDDQRAGSDVVIITHPDFVASLAPLVQLRQSQGHHVSLVTTDQIFDEFNYGERSPFAIRSFLQEAASRWQRRPQSILFVGDASFDPRDYLGLGDFDFVPTRIIETAAFKTASDDWFTDFAQNGFATIPTGRLPVRTSSDADLVVSKIVGYESGNSTGSWNSQALLIADQNTDSNFSSAANSASATLPSTLQVSEILADSLDSATARSQILAALNNGALLVDYNGHGAEQQWSFADLFDTNDATALSNGGRLPVYLLMDCLNGFFHDVYAESLAESLLLAPNGGAVAVWASSGFTQQSPQATMNQAFVHLFAGNPNQSLGRIVLQAKAGTTDNDVRRTWILFGDPAMKLQFAPTGVPAKTPARVSWPVIAPVRNHPCLPVSVCSKEKQPQ